MIKLQKYMRNKFHASELQFKIRFENLKVFVSHYYVKMLQK